ncbi:MAG: putative toxin-antitoxin system toxin component, PIN family [archaeon]
MRVVLDTNIFVSGIHWSGKSGRIIEKWLAGEFTLITSPEIINEIIRTLEKFRIPLSSEKIQLWKRALETKSIAVIPSQKLSVISDPDDNKFLEAAIEGNALYLVSQDGAVLKVGAYKGVLLVNPEEFLKRLENH